MNQPLIKVENLQQVFIMGENKFQALKGLNFEIGNGELLAIVGESGCGKTTTMNILGLLARPSAGQYYLNGTEVSQLTSDEQAELRNKRREEPVLAR